MFSDPQLVRPTNSIPFVLGVRLFSEAVDLEAEDRQSSWNSPRRTNNYGINTAFRLLKIEKNTEKHATKKRVPRDITGRPFVRGWHSPHQFDNKNFQVPGMS